MTKFAIHFLFLIMGVAYLARASRTFYWQTVGFFTAGMVVNSIYGLAAAACSRVGVEPRPGDPLADHRRREQHQHLRRGRGRELFGRTRSPATRTASGSMLPHSAARAHARLPAPRAWPPVEDAACRHARLPAHRRADDALAQRPARPHRRAGVLALPYRRFFLTRAFLAPLAGVAGLLWIVVLSRLDYFQTISRSRVRTGGGASQAHFGVYDFIPDVLATQPLFGLGLNNFSVYYEQVTGKTNWGPHSFFVALFVETGLVGDGAVRRLHLVPLRPPRRRPSRRARARRSWGHCLRPRDAARMGDDGRARRDARRQSLLPHDDLLLRLRVRGARARLTRRLRARVGGGSPEHTARGVARPRMTAPTAFDDLDGVLHQLVTGTR